MRYGFTFTPAPRSDIMPAVVIYLVIRFDGWLRLVEKERVKLVVGYGY